MCRGLECWPWSWVGLNVLPQGVGAPPAMLRERTAGFPKKLGGRASGEAGKVDTICTVFPRTVPPTVALWHTNHEQAVSVWCSPNHLVCYQLGIKIIVQSISFVRLLMHTIAYIYKHSRGWSRNP